MPDSPQALKDTGHGSQAPKREERDEGCAWYTSCLKCPMPKCKFDNKQPIAQERT